MKRFRVCLPVTATSTYDVDSTAIQIAVDVPTDLLEATTADDLLVETSGITAGMTLDYNIPQDGTVMISASDTTPRALFGQGTLFNIYLRQKAVTGTGDLLLVDDATEREGVRIYKTENPPELAEIELLNGLLTTNSSGTCIHGDVNQDLEITEADVRRIHALVVGKFAHTACSLWAGDLTGDDRVDAADAVQLSRWLAGEPINPPPADAKNAASLGLSSFAVRAADKAALSPKVWIDAAEGTPGATISVALRLRYGAPVTGFTTRVSFLSGREGMELDSVALGADNFGLDLALRRRQRQRVWQRADLRQRRGEPRQLMRKRSLRS